MHDGYNSVMSTGTIDRPGTEPMQNLTIDQDLKSKASNSPYPLSDQLIGNIITPERNHKSALVRRYITHSG